MKRIYHILLLISIFYNATLPITSTLTPENTEIIFDIDDVLTEKMGYGVYEAKLAFGGIAQNPLNAINYIHALLNLEKASIKDKNGNRTIYDDKGNKLNGVTFHFLYQGMRDPLLTPYVAWMVETIENSRWFISGTIKICNYLKHKGYTINYATNKDRVSYNLTAQAFGDKFTSIPAKVFVAHPGNGSHTIAQVKEFADHPTTDASYRKIAYQFLEAQPTNNIFHTPSRKPELEYFEYVAKTIGNGKNLVFIDDQKANVEGFNKLQETTIALRYGIQFRNSIQLADDLINLGILSPTEDTKLLDEIGYPHLMRMYKYPKSAAA